MADSFFTAIVALFSGVVTLFSDVMASLSGVLTSFLCSLDIVSVQFSPHYLVSTDFVRVPTELLSLLSI